MRLTPGTSSARRATTVCPTATPTSSATGVPIARSVLVIVVEGVVSFRPRQRLCHFAACGSPPAAIEPTMARVDQQWTCAHSRLNRPRYESPANMHIGRTRIRTASAHSAQMIRANDCSPAGRRKLVQGCLPQPASTGGAEDVVATGSRAVSVKSAVREARRYYDDVNSCYFCARECHTTLEMAAAVASDPSEVRFP